MADLDAVDGPADAGRFRRVLADELARTPRRVGRLGRGVQVGDLESVYGLDLDLVVVVGMAEGWYPPRHRDDPLLPDHELGDAGLADALGRPDRSDERRDHLAARAAGADVVLLAPRSDPRGQRELQPARWLLEELSARTGWAVGVGDVAELEVGGLERPRSFEESVRKVSVPLDAGSGTWPRSWRRPRPGPRSCTITRSWRPTPASPAASRRSRRGGTGPTASGPATSASGTSCASTTRRWPSATRLERFALCPFQYLLGNVLGVRAHEDPVDEEGITPRDRGSLVHQVLEEFFAEALDRDPDAGWTDADLERLHAIVDHVGEAYRARGMTGRDLGWELESSAIRRWLGAVLDRDADERSARQARPAAVELLFGGDSEHPAAEVGLPDGRRLRFKGAIDRVDREADGSLLVIDYKTGRGVSYRNVDDDRLDRGKRLQLPIYADAARRALGPATGRPRRSRPTTGSSRRAGRRPGGAGRSTTRSRTASRTSWPPWSTASRAATSPPTRARRAFYGPSHCGYCDFNRVCPSSRVDLWEGVRKDDAARTATSSWPRGSCRDPGRPPFRPGGPRAHPRRSRPDPVRRGRCGHGQDDGPRGPGGRAGHQRSGHRTPGAGRHHVHRGRRRRAAGPGARAARAGRRPPRPRRRGPGPGRRRCWPTSTRSRSRRCTASPAACSASSRSRRACPPASRWRTRSRPRCASTAAGWRWWTTCTRTPTSGRSSAGPWCSASRCAAWPRWPGSSTTTGTGWARLAGRTALSPVDVAAVVEALGAAARPPRRLHRPRRPALRAPGERTPGRSTGSWPC